MGTRSRIGVMHGDKVKSIYCHGDGYLQHNGRILQEHYDSARANHIVALGDMSSLQADIGEKHAFSKHDVPGIEVRVHNDEWCTFYGRDRGEKGVEFKVDHTFDQFLDRAEGCDAEYYYVMENGQWYFGSMHEQSPFYKRLVLLSEALESEAVKA